MRSRRLVTFVLVVLAVTSLAMPAMAQSGQAADAELVVRQPHYIDGGVESFDANGTAGYRVEGPVQTLKPVNFDPENVVNSGVASGAGQLSYDSEVGTYRLDAEGNTGTFRAFWTVEEPTENGTESTQYQAVIRVTGQAALEHQAAGTQSDMQADAEKWRDFNATVSDIREQDLLFQGSGASNDQIIESALNLYTDVNDPFRLLQGGVTQFHLMLVLSFGFSATFMVYMAFWAINWYRERKKNQEFESIEDAEGELSERLREQHDQQRYAALNNWDFNDITENDHFADALRELGESPRAGWERISAEILTPQVWIADKLATMGEDGWTAVVHDRDADGEITDAELVKDAVDDTETVDLTDEELSESLCATLCTDDAFESYDLRKTTVTPADHNEPRLTHDLDELRDRLDEQLDWFDDPEQGGDLLHDLVEAVAESPYTDTTGAPKAERRALEEWLHEAQLLRDEFGFGLARLQAETLEYALASYDPGANADRYREKVEEGRE